MVHRISSIQMIRQNSLFVNDHKFMLFELLTMTQIFHSSGFDDKGFAQLGMASGFRGTGDILDYSQDCDSVFRSSQSTV